MKIYLNLDSREELDTALDEFPPDTFSGIGLIRTEHLILPVIEDFTEWLTQVTSPDPDLGKLLPAKQKVILHMTKELISIVWGAPEGWPILVRHFDPPLHEFLPDAGRIEVNPMMGLRGQRLLTAYPALKVITTSAVMKAWKPRNDLRMMMPMSSPAVVPSYDVMLETPAACVQPPVGSSLTKTFYSFGTNDLTAFTHGVSRDDFASVERGLSEGERNIFTELSLPVLNLMGTATRLLRSAYPPDKLSIGCCGEQAANSVPNLIGMVDYISVSLGNAAAAVLAVKECPLPINPCRFGI